MPADPHPRSPRRTMLALALVVALVAAACGVDDPSTASVPAGGRDAGAPISWGPCPDAGDDDPLECGTVPVALDRADPGGATIDLAIARLPHTGDGERVGSVLVNPGGPGQGGVDFLRQFEDLDRLPEGIEDRFDVVSWDPRGTGDSAGIRCLTDDQREDPEPDPTIEDAGDEVAIAEASEEFLAGCRADAGDRLTQVGTEATVADLETLRRAVGDDTLTYIGYSYGTTIGLEYLRRYGDRVRAMVLDGLALPGGNPVEEVAGQAENFEANLEAFFADCAGDVTCPFGGDDPRGAFLDLVDELESGTRIPADHNLLGTDREGSVGTGELYTAVFAALYSKDNWPTLGAALAQADQTGTAPILLALRDQFAGLTEDGVWKARQDAFSVISCDDQELRAEDPDGDDALRAEWSRRWPLVGSVFATGTPGCFDFPAAPDPVPTLEAGDIAGSVPPVVLVGSTMDPATPYRDAERTAALVPGSRLVTWDAADHTAYGRGSDCLDDPLTAYLADLKVPDEGLTCSP